VLAALDFASYRTGMASPAESELQPELLLGEQASPDMRFAARQMAVIQKELSHRNRYVLRTAGRWLDLFDYIKMLEEDHLYASGRVAEHKQFFHGSIAVVRGLGTLLLAKLQNDDAEQLRALGITYRDLVACVEELAHLERGLHSDLTPAMVAEMNDRLFGGQPA
jgi:hypothetical protein